MNNPFTPGVIPPEAPFCNRQKELKELKSYASSSANVVLYSPRRYGKTSLVRRVQSGLSKKKVITIYVDLFGVTTIDEIAKRTARSVYLVTQKDKPLFKKVVTLFKTFRPVLKPTETGDSFTVTVEPATSSLTGIDLLEATMTDLGMFIQATPSGVNIAFDEFQEITELNSLEIEGVLRSHIQTQKASYFFVGSRRRVLLDMFNLRNRPFFQSSILYKLSRLPYEDLVRFIVECFNKSGKRCSKEIAEKISKKAFQHPYYAQKLSFYVFEISGKTIESADVSDAYDKVIEDERYFFEASTQGLTIRQVSLLKALADDSSQPVYSSEFLSKHRLSQGLVQKALPKLSNLDLIEKNDQNGWEIVDPVFREWLKRI